MTSAKRPSLRRRLEVGRLMVGSLVEFAIKAYGAGAAASFLSADLVDRLEIYRAMRRASSCTAVSPRSAASSAASSTFPWPSRWKITGSRQNSKSCWHLIIVT